MQKTQIKGILFFLLALVTGVEVTKTETSFLKIWCKYLNNGLFYCNYSIKFCSNYIPLCLNKFDFNYRFF